MTQDENIFEETSAAEPTPFFLAINLKEFKFSRIEASDRVIRKMFDAVQKCCAHLSRQESLANHRLTEHGKQIDGLINDLQDRLKIKDDTRKRVKELEETIESLKESLEGAHQNREAIVKSDLPYIRERLSILESAHMKFCETSLSRRVTALEDAHSRYSQSVTMPPENWEAKLGEALVKVGMQISHVEDRLDFLERFRCQRCADTGAELAEHEKRLQYIESALLKGGIIPGKTEPKPIAHGTVVKPGDMIQLPFEVFMAMLRGARD